MHTHAITVWHQLDETSGIICLSEGDVYLWINSAWFYVKTKVKVGAVAPAVVRSEEFSRTPRTLQSDLQQTFSVRANGKLSGIDEGGKRAQLQWDLQPSTAQAFRREHLVPCTDEDRITLNAHDCLWFSDIRCLGLTSVVSFNAITLQTCKTWFTV